MFWLAKSQLVFAAWKPREEFAAPLAVGRGNPAFSGQRDMIASTCERLRSGFWQRLRMQKLHSQICHCQAHRCVLSAQQPQMC